MNETVCIPYSAIFLRCYLFADGPDGRFVEIIFTDQGPLYVYAIPQEMFHGAKFSRFATNP